MSQNESGTAYGADSAENTMKSLEAGDRLVWNEPERELEIVEIDRRTTYAGTEIVEATGRKSSGATVDLREHHLANALASGAEIERGDEEVEA